MTVMINRFYATKGRHIVITLPVLCVLSVMHLCDFVHIIWNLYGFRHCLMTVMINRFYATKGRHIVITLPVLCV